MRDVYVAAAERDDDMHVVDCSVAGDSMASPEEIFGRIESIVKRYMIG